MILTSDTELKILDQMAGDFARKELAKQKEKTGGRPFTPLSDSIIDKAEAAGFFNALLPEEFGGAGFPPAGLCLILDQVCREEGSLGGIIFTNAASQEIFLVAGGGDPLKAIISQGNKAADRLIAFAAYNDPADMQLLVRAEREKGPGYRLSGHLPNVVLGGLAGQALIPARIHECPGYSFFLVQLDSTGVHRGKTIPGLGMQACPSTDLDFDQAHGLLIGEQGQGMPLYAGMAEKMHLAAAAMSAGVMKGSFREAREYARQRLQGGRRIVDWTEVRMILTDMAVKVQIADMVVDRACQILESQVPGWAQCTLAAALHVQEMACDLTAEGIQILGGAGYMEDFGQEKRFRDAQQMRSLLGSAPVRKLRGGLPE